jgi:plastocyanin domain-containing protein
LTRMTRARSRPRLCARREFNMKLFSRKHESGTAVDAAEGSPRLISVDGGYTPDTLYAAAGEPVSLVFHRHDGSPCSEEVVFPDQGVRATLAQHEDVVVELPASEPGEYDFHCGMGMLHGRLVVR